MNFEFSYPDIVKQCKTMAYLNVISFCLLSGCGNIAIPDEEELSRIYSLLKDTKSSRMPKNITFMSSLYKKCMPVYASAPENPYDFAGFRWNGKKVKRDIEPDVLAHSIYSMTALIPAILKEEIQVEQKEFIAYCLKTAAIKQARFLVNFLKLGDFYYVGSDSGDNAYGEYNIAINNENPDLRTQFYVGEALSAVINSHDQGGTLEKYMDILPVICENVIESINDISSRDLSSICLSLLATLKQSNLHKETVYNTANSIGFELCERLAHTGDIYRNVLDDSSSSFVTLCNCMNCLISLHEVNDIAIYRDSYLKLYDRIDSYWDAGCSLFLTISKKKQKFNFKDIAQILAALRSLRDCLTDPDLYMHLDKQLSSFYGSAMLSSKLFNSQFYPILQENKLELHNLGACDKNSAPVFGRCFEIKVTKKKYYCKPDVFQAGEILLGCKYLLY